MEHKARQIHLLSSGEARARHRDPDQGLLRHRKGASYCPHRAGNETLLIDPELSVSENRAEEKTFFVENAHPNQSYRLEEQTSTKTEPTESDSPHIRETGSLANNWRRRKRHILERITELEQEQSSLQNAAVRPAVEERLQPAVELMRAQTEHHQPPVARPRTSRRRKSTIENHRDTYTTSILRLHEINISDVYALFTRPPPPGRTLQLTLFREKAGLTRRFFPQYRLALSEDLGFALGTALKRATRGGSLYDLCTESGGAWRLRSNFLGTEFSLGTATEELAFIEYQQNFLGIKGPRKFGVALRREEATPLKEALRDHAHDRAHLFWNNPPRWSDQHGAYVLDFFDRVERASVKNFQLLIGDELALQFGKASDDVFHLDVRAPFTPLLALGVAVSSCDGKLFCE